MEARMFLCVYVCSREGGGRGSLSAVRFIVYLWKTGVFAFTILIHVLFCLDDTVFD